MRLIRFNLLFTLMTAPQDHLTDEDLASKISEDGRLSSDPSQNEEEGVLETGIHGNMRAVESEQDPSLVEEPFSVDDFEEGVNAEEPQPSSKSDSDQDISEANNFEEKSLATAATQNHLQSSDSLENGDVAQFRNSLSALSRQLEIDRLTFLYRRMKEEGKPLPDLGKIASDIRGDSQLQPIGDEDMYAKRPIARLQGWIAGLSFGIGKRAKKFPK